MVWASRVAAGGHYPSARSLVGVMPGRTTARYLSARELAWVMPERRTAVEWAYVNVLSAAQERLRYDASSGPPRNLSLCPRLGRARGAGHFYVAGGADG